MESQAYGYSDNENGVRAQQDLQQGYNNEAHPFAAPPQQVQDFNQQSYNVQPQQFDQQYQQYPQFDQQYPQQFNQQYSQPQTQFPYVQPYAYTPNNDDIPPDHNTAAPSEVVVSLNGQDDVRNHKYNDDDNLKHENDQPTQDQNNKPEKAKPERAKTFQEYKRSITHWGSSDCIGGITSFLGIGSVFVILVLLITLMAYHFGKKDVSLTAIAGGLNYMAMNLNTDPILQLTWNGNDCAPDSTKIHFGRWPGTSSGCDCPITGLKTGHCSKNESKTCSDYSDIDYQDMFRWEGSVFCAKRARLNVDYVKASTCPTGFKSCCPSNVDPSQCSVGICMRDGLGCPLTDIAVLSTGNATDILVQGKYVHLSYTPGGNPVIDMDITNGDVPCFNANEQPKGGDYYLLESHADGCSTYGVDKLFSPMIDRTSETRVITFNNLPKDVLKLPGYKRITDATNSYLSARKRITVANKDACLSLDTKILNNAGTAANDLNRFVSGTAITAMVFHSILVLIFCGLFYLAGRGGDCSDLMKGKNSGTWLFFYCIIMPIELIVYIVMVPLVRSARSDLVASQTYLGNLDKLGCFPIGPPKQIISDYNDAVDEVASTLDGLATSLLAITLICFGSIALGLIYKVKYRGY